MRRGVTVEAGHAWGLWYTSDSGRIAMLWATTPGTPDLFRTRADARRKMREIKDWHDRCGASHSIRVVKVLLRARGT